MQDWISVNPGEVLIVFSLDLQLRLLSDNICRCE